MKNLIRTQRNENIYVNASCLPLSKVTDYEGTQGLDKVVISNGKIVNVVSENYGFLPNENFFPVIEKQLSDLGYTYEKKYQNIKDCYFVADYIFNDASFTLKNVKGYRDTLKPKLRFINSYDGSAKTSGYMSFFREVCSNGLHGIKEDVAFSLRHSGSIQSLVLPNISKMIQSYTSNEGIEIIRRFDVLAESEVKDINEFIHTICDVTKVFKFEASEKNPDPSINARFVLDVVAREVDTLQMKPNAWIVYNAVNEWIYNNDRNQKHEVKRQQLDESVFKFIELTVN